MAEPTIVNWSYSEAQNGQLRSNYWPNTEQVDDVGLLMYLSTGVGGQLPTPSGWTEIAGSPQSTGDDEDNDLHLQLFWKRVTATNLPDIDYTCTGEHVHSALVLYRGCIPTGSPVGGSAGGTTSTASLVKTWPTITGTASDSRILLVGGTAKYEDSGLGTNNFVNAALDSFNRRWENDGFTGDGGVDSIMWEEALPAGGGDSDGLVVGTTTADHPTLSKSATFTIELLGIPPMKPGVDTSTANSIVQPVPMGGPGVDVSSAEFFTRTVFANTASSPNTAAEIRAGKAIGLLMAGADVGTAGGMTRTAGPRTAEDISSALRIAAATSIPLLEALAFSESVAVPVWGVSPSESLSVVASTARAYTGAVVLEAGFIGIEASAAALGVALSEVASLTPATLVARAITVAEALGINVSALPNTVVGLSYADNLALVPGLLRFLDGLLTDTLNVSNTTTAKKLGTPVGVEALELSGTLGMDVVFSITSTEALTLTDAELVQAILLGNITEELLFTLGALSDAGDFTTWAMNTATLGVAGYDNYNFNSYAEFGGRYLGASSSGLYTLDGGSDAGTDVIATLRSGFTQFAGAKLSVLDAAYLGVRGDGDFIFKVVTAEGKTYSYAARVDSMKTTRVTLGRGLRTRYIAFELVSTGQDFDLESVEFSPLDLVRRV